MTTAQVKQLTHCVDESLIARLFARFRGRYGNLWTSRATCDDDWEFIMEDWLEELSKFSIEHVRAAVNKTLTEFKEFPPTLGQLVDLCMKESGVPQPHEVVRLMVSRDFSHPLVKMVYDKIGSWTLTNGKEEEIDRKVKEHYQSSRSEFYVDPKTAWSQLESFNAKPKELPPPSKIPSSGESKAFRECMNKCQEILRDKKIAGGGKTYKHFDENKVKKGHRDFEPAVFEEYKAYLLSIPEVDVLILPPTYAYERSRLIAQKEQPEILRKAGYNPNPQGNTCEPPRRSRGPSKVHASWVSD